MKLVSSLDSERGSEMAAVDSLPESGSGSNARMVGDAACLIYGVLMLWAFICLFPIYWTITTTFKTAAERDAGRHHSLGSGTISRTGWAGARSACRPTRSVETPRCAAEFMARFRNSVIGLIAASVLAVVLGSLAAYGLSRFHYRFGYMRNSDISFFFLSQLILPPVVLALPFLVLYKELALLDTRIGLILLYTLTVLPIVIWIMRDQFDAIPTELEEAALVDGCAVWGAFFRIILPIALPGHGGGLHPVAGAELERVFLRGAAHHHQRQDPAGDGGQPDRLAGHQLVVDGRAFLGRNPAAYPDRHLPGAVHHKGLTAGAVK